MLFRSEGDKPLMLDGKVADATALLSADLHGMRAELGEAQRKDPSLREIIAVLERKPAGESVAAPRGGDFRRARARAEDYLLGEDGLLLRKGVDGPHLPVIPSTVYDGALRSPEAPAKMTWKHLLLGSVHNAAAHRGVNDMVTELKSCVAWFPPERLKPDCQLWFDRCKHCMAVHRRAAGDPPNISVMERKPFFRMVIDLVEIQPSGTDGERYVLTCI